MEAGKVHSPECLLIASNFHDMDICRYTYINGTSNDPQIGQKATENFSDFYLTETGKPLFYTFVLQKNNTIMETFNVDENIFFSMYSEAQPIY